MMIDIILSKFKSKDFLLFISHVWGDWTTQFLFFKNLYLFICFLFHRPCFLSWKSDSQDIVIIKYILEKVKCFKPVKFLYCCVWLNIPERKCKINSHCRPFYLQSPPIPPPLHVPFLFIVFVERMGWGWVKDSLGWGVFKRLDCRFMVWWTGLWCNVQCHPRVSVKFVTVSIFEHTQPTILLLIVKVMLY